jgi:hypothetical protein
MDLATAKQAADLVSQMQTVAEQQLVIGAAIAANATLSSGTLALRNGPDGALSIPTLSAVETAILLNALLTIFQHRVDNAAPALTALLPSLK